MTKGAIFDCHRTKLSPEQRQAVLRLLGQLPIRQIAVRFGVGASTIRRIKQAHRPPTQTRREPRPVSAQGRTQRLSRDKVSPEKVQLIIFLSNRDYSDEGEHLCPAKIAGRVGVSEQTVKTILAGYKPINPFPRRAAKPGGWEKYLY